MQKAVGVHNRDSVSKDRWSSTSISRVRYAILIDKGVDNRAACLENTHASQRKNPPGVCYEHVRRPGTAPA